MSVTKYFNFNNEQALTQVEQHEDGTVTFAIGDAHESFDSLQEFAEFYALARNVLPENLKNWVLIEDGNQFAFVLRASTGAVTDAEIETVTRALFAAGRTPSEVGVILAEILENAGGRDEDVDGVTEGGDYQEFKSELERIYSAEEISFIFGIYCVDSIKGLFDDLVDAELETEFEQQYYDEYTGEIEIGYDEISYVQAMLNDVAVSFEDALNELSHNIPRVPKDVLIAIVNGSTDELAGDGQEDVAKQFFAASVAGRPTVEVAIVDKEHHTGEVRMVSADELAQYATPLMVSGRVILFR